MNVHKIGHAKLIDDIIEALQKKADSTEELIVLRAYRGTDGVKRLEWWTTAISSRVWAIGALNYLAYKVERDSDGWDDDDDEE